MDTGLIYAQAMATRSACLRMTAEDLKAMHDSVEHASCLSARSRWDSKAAAHAGIFSLLAQVADDIVSVRVLSACAGFMHELMLVVGPAADGMIISSRRRLLAHMRAGDADGAALEIEEHLRSLDYMWRLAR
jgi:GntR family transcriptional repressor for pyruvate dehydrogenase complex